MYVSGFDVIELEGTEITTEQRSTVREAVQGLVGLEVLGDSQPGGRPRPARLLGAVDPQRGHADAPDLSLSMLEDAIAALSERDHDLARDVIGRDDDLDRLWLVVSRIFRATLRTPKAAEELGLPARSFDYHSSARQLERIGDHRPKIAHLTLNIDEPLPDDVVEAVNELHGDAVEVIDTAMDALFADDSEGGDSPRERGTHRWCPGDRRASARHRRTAPRPDPTRATARAGRRLRASVGRLRR